ncbi:hypothetical protein Desmu_0413 [Desulfurococcus mucosus DSM 2162]|uniref:Uncharacterized protein n=2 Tax=Desulfurococcus mucosus TaxID=2275 RepID=E8R8A6_DESM0|nr:hypothetical protein Desmu_0413 [Desulfurococcus mucosus DSM 2162]
MSTPMTQQPRSLPEAVAEALAAGPVDSVVEYARRVVAEKLVGEVSPGKVSRYIRKALRLGVWGRLRRVSRALLYAVTRLKAIRSPVLAGIVSEILVEIELASTRGLAVFYGVIVSLKRGFTCFLGDLRRLVTIGVAYISLPPAFRYYG